MKKYIFLSGLITAVSLALYPLNKALAFAERGYHAHGGETLLLFLGIVGAVTVLVIGYQKTYVLKQYTTCDNCGAHLDPGEICDCGGTKKGSLPLAEKPPLTESEQSILPL
ncbi:MAG: hypothetical protein LBS21_06805 [Clostridiales bacterium]|jgi:hypothetical protein|nr:hypothetical protein [Clostridiales bacterium]